MKHSSSRVSQKVGVSPRFTRFARAGLSGASADAAWIASSHSTACSATSLGLRATRRSDLMPAVPHTSGPTPKRTSTPNHALQRTGMAVTARASRHLRPPPPSPAHGPRQPCPSLSLGSLGVATRVVFNDTLLPDLSNFIVSAFFPVFAPRSGHRCPARHPFRQFAVLS